MSDLQLTNQSTDLMMIDAQTKKWELSQRKAIAYSKSSLVPVPYRSLKEIKGDYGKVTGYEENPSGVSNCMIAIDMAERLRANELMVMQNLYIIEGRPSWSSQWKIATVNNCGRFSPLKFKVEDLGVKTVSYVDYTYQNNKRVPVQKTIEIHDYSCVAYATEKATGDELESAKISIEMAVKEGWYTKNGSKWQTMPEVMLRYRAASFFANIYAPELSMGLPTTEEIQDTVDLSAKYPDAIMTESPQNNDRPSTFSETITKPHRRKPENKESEPAQNIVDGVDQATGEVLQQELLDGEPIPDDATAEEIAEAREAGISVQLLRKHKAF